MQQISGEVFHCLEMLWNAASSVDLSPQRKLKLKSKPRNDVKEKEYLFSSFFLCSLKNRNPNNHYKLFWFPLFPLIGLRRSFEIPGIFFLCKVLSVWMTTRWKSKKTMRNGMNCLHLSGIFTRFLDNNLLDLDWGVCYWMPNCVKEIINSYLLDNFVSAWTGPAEILRPVSLFAYTCNKKWQLKISCTNFHPLL